MKLFPIISILILAGLHSFQYKAQETLHAIRKVEELEGKLIGMKLKKAVKTLELDTNFRVISEPPGKYRGVRSFDIEGWQVQLIVRPTLVNKRMKSKGVYAVIRNKRIIGISWMSPEKCNSVGEVIQQHAYNRFGPCDH